MPEISTDQYWKNREDVGFSTEHSHRKEIIEVLKKMKFNSLLDIGCGYGANLKLIQKEFPNVSLSGIDINKKAIKITRKNVKGYFVDGDIEKLPFEDNSYDVVLTDAVLLLYPDEKINKVISELKRVARKTIIMVEWQGKDKYLVGHYVRDYTKLFPKCEFTKIKDWDIRYWIKFGYIIKVNL